MRVRIGCSHLISGCEIMTVFTKKVSGEKDIIEMDS